MVFLGTAQHDLRFKYLSSPPTTKCVCASSNRHCSHTPTTARCLFQVLHDQILLGDMFDSPGRVLFQAVERDGFQAGLCIIRREDRVSLQPVRVGFPPLAVGCAQAELEHGLKASAEILIEETVDDGVDAAVEEGQPVGKGVDVNVDDPVLLLSQPGVVAQHHESPQRQPGQDEEQSNYEKHFNDALLFLGHRVAVLVARLSSRWNCCFEKRNPNPGVHDHNEGKRGKIDVGKQDCGVNLSHVLVWPVLSAPIKRNSFVIISQQHPDGLLLGHL